MTIKEARIILEHPKFGDPDCLKAISVIKSEEDRQFMIDALAGKNGKCPGCNGRGECEECHGFGERELDHYDLSWLDTKDLERRFNRLPSI